MGISADIWLWIGGAFIAFVLGVAAFRAKVRTFISEGEWWGTLVTSPKKAFRDLGSGGNQVTKNDLDGATVEILNDDRVNQILAILKEQQAEKQARGEAPPPDAQEEALTEEAVQDVLADPSLSARAAADALREGRVAEAFRILRSDAEAGEAETAERWRRLGALARGIDTAQALEAYEAAFRIQPSDFWTCIELARLRVQSGNLKEAERAVNAARAGVRTERMRSIALLETAEIHRLGGCYNEALKKLRQVWRIDRALVKMRPFDKILLRA